MEGFFMKVTKRFLINLIKEAKGDDTCPAATQDRKLNAKNKRHARRAKHIKYGNPKRRKELQKLLEENKLCKNCTAYDTSAKMKKCGVNTKEFGYCHMHGFSCAKQNTCLTWKKK